MESRDTFRQSACGEIIIKLILVKDNIATLGSFFPGICHNRGLRGAFRALRIPYALDSHSFDDSELGLRIIPHLFGWNAGKLFWR